MKEYIKILNRSWLAAMIYSLLVVAAEAVAYFAFGLSPKQNFSRITLYICMAVMIFLLLDGFKFSQRRIKRLEGKDLAYRLENYKTILSRSLMDFMIASMVSVVVVLVTGMIESVIFAVMSVLLILLQRQNELKVKVNLFITEEDMKNFAHIRFERKHR